MQWACVILSSVASPGLQYFPALSHKRRDFRKKVIEHEICVLNFSTSFVWNFSHYTINWARYDEKCVLVFMYSNWYCQIVIEREFSRQVFEKYSNIKFNPLNPELNPICYLLALLGAHHFHHVSRIRVKLLTFRLLMSYIYGAPILDVSRSHTTTQHSR